MAHDGLKPLRAAHDAIRSFAKQARAIVFRIREQLVNQRTELVNALRAHLYEFGYVAPQGVGYLNHLSEIVEDEDTELPGLVRDTCCDLLNLIVQLTGRIDMLERKIAALSKHGTMTRREAVHQAAEE